MTISLIIWISLASTVILTFLVGNIIDWIKNKKFRKDNK